jgi:hypothetical protein
VIFYFLGHPWINELSSSRGPVEIISELKNIWSPNSIYSRDGIDIPQNWKLDTIPKKCPVIECLELIRTKAKASVVIIQKDENSSTSRRRVVESSE